MSQPSIASYFHSRKRAAVDEIFNSKTKVLVVDQQQKVDDNLALNTLLKNKVLDCDDVSSTTSAVCVPGLRLESDTTVKNKIIVKPTTVTEISTTAESSPLLKLKAHSNSTSSQSNVSSKTKLRRCIKQKSSGCGGTSGGEKSSRSLNQPKIVKFTLAGNLSPQKRISLRNGNNKPSILSSTTKISGGIIDKPSSVAAVLFGTKDNANNVDRGLKTPTKEQKIERAKAEEINSIRNNLSVDAIKVKLTKSSRLQELTASMSRIQELEDGRQKIIQNNKFKQLTADKHSFNNQQSDRAALILGKSLKQFSTIDLEVLTSPQKGFSTPVKISSPGKLPTPTTNNDNNNKNELMSPKKTATPRRLFSPTKSSPSKSVSTSLSSTITNTTLPAFQRFQSLIERPTLQMPYKYRCLAETFKCLDTVCAMFFNRHETITMKKLKPAVQRMLRKNFTESNLAQIHFLYPEAYKFNQKKMLNAGSHTKYDYYQLIITPNVKQSLESSKKLNEDDIIRSGQEQTMNPQMMTERQQKFNNLLLDVVKTEHDKFLRNLDPPMIISKDKITRWHAEFDLQNCPEIEMAELPQPPNVDKFSSAKEVLSTARNLFNCATPMERAMERFEMRQHQQQQQQQKQNQQQQEQDQEKEIDYLPPVHKKPIPPATIADQVTDTESEPSTTPTTMGGGTTGSIIHQQHDSVSAILKGVPKSLLERIRAKQAAKALDAMTRRPSQDKEASKYERLPELARYLRNIFVTESKSVLELDLVLEKLGNSYRERLAKDNLKELLQLISKEAPQNWLSFHYLRKNDYVKIKKDIDANEIIQVLEQKAADRSR